ncbi:MAG TPA: hypothetical protein VG228_06720 [Solirubrobacteraceae bacterium]|jgi:hypothetical protein|nr:hypothetical protein [Solirubrobacteraceae bacterium]
MDEAKTNSSGPMRGALDSITDLPIGVVRGIRDEIEAHVKQLLETLPAPSSPAHVGSAS